MDLLTTRNIIIFSLLSTSAILITYASKFGFNLSPEHTHWAQFGSFVSGTIGPILSIASILFLYISTSNQINDLKRQRVIENQEKQIERISIFLHNEMTSTHSFIPGPEQAFKDFNWNGDDIEKPIHIGDGQYKYHNHKIGHSFIYGKSNIFSFLQSYIRLTEEIDTAINSLINENSFLIEAKLRTFCTQYKYLLCLCYDLLDKDYDLISIRFILAEPFAQVRTLHKLGLIDDITLKRSAYLQSLPINIDFPQIDEKGLIQKSFNESFGGIKEIEHLPPKSSENMNFIHFRVRDISNQKTYILKEDFEWNEEQ